MLPLILAAAAAAAAGGGAGYFGAKSKNKKTQGVSYNPQPYTGYRPPHVSYLRPVEQQITDIVMRRSRGEDVGFDPARRNELMDIYDIDAGRRAERENADFNNQLSGAGLSRNIAAREKLIGRAASDRAADRSIYQKGVDVEDLTRRNEERDTNTARLQNLNTFNFGQENDVANFDKSVWDTEQGNAYRQAMLEMGKAENYDDPWASGVESGLNYGMGAYSLGQGSPMMSSVGSPNIETTSGNGYRKDINNQYMDPSSSATKMALLKKSRNLFA